MNQTFTHDKPKAVNAVQHLFSKTSAFTLSCSLTAMTIFVLLRTLVSTFDAYQLDELKAIYYFAGNSDIAVGIINFAFGIIACAILFLASFGMFKAVSANKIQHSNQLLKGIDLMKTALVSAIIFTVIMIVCSLSSVSLMNYQYRLTANSLYYRSSSSTANSLFFAAILFGTLSLTLEIALTRLVLAMQRTIKNGIMEKQGSALAIVISSISAVTMVIVFLAALFNLVMPSSINGGLQKLSPVTLAMDTLTVLLSATVSVISITLIVVVAIYVGFIEDTKKNEHIKIYNNLFANNAPSPYKNYSSPQNYNYRQPDNYPPYYDANRAFNGVYGNIYENKVPPVPKKPDTPFKPPVDMPHTEYPAQTAAKETETETKISLEKNIDEVKKGD